MRYYFFLFIFLLFSPLSLLAQQGNNTCPRIISQSPYISEMLDYLGMGKCIIGVSRYSKRDLPRTGGILDPDAEAIDALMPDLVITSDWADREKMQAIIPQEAKLLRLKSFSRMDQLEDNMKTIVRLTGWKEADKKIDRFASAWRKKLQQVKGNARKVLLLSSCSGNAYSFGANTRLYDLFTRAGFRVIETKEKIRHIRPGEEISSVTALVNQYQPELLFIFERRLNKQCQMIVPKVPLKIISFDGQYFLNPNVKILQGLDILISKNHLWK